MQKLIVSKLLYIFYAKIDCILTRRQGKITGVKK